MRVNNSPYTNTSSSIVNLSVARIREATAKLRAAGVRDPDAIVRLGAAVMVERCLAKYEARSRRGEVGPGWLAAAVRQGDAFPDVEAPPRRESASELIRALEDARAAG